VVVYSSHVAATTIYPYKTEFSVKSVAITVEVSRPVMFLVSGTNGCVLFSRNVVFHQRLGIDLEEGQHLIVDCITCMVRRSPLIQCLILSLIQEAALYHSCHNSGSKSPHSVLGW